MESGTTSRENRPALKSNSVCRWSLADSAAFASTATALERLGEYVGEAGEAWDIENESDLAVPHDSRADVATQRLELFAERFDDDLLGVADSVDDQTEGSLFRLQNDDVENIAVLIDGRKTENPAEMSEGEQLASAAIDLGALDALDLFTVFCALEAHQLK